jgi:hypothetical protein
MFSHIKRAVAAKILTRTLLAGACLLLACGSASATLYIEGISPMPADFSNSGATPFLMPTGPVGVFTDTVVGTTTVSSDTQDWFHWGFLFPGASFTFQFNADTGGTAVLYSDHGVTVLHSFSPANSGIFVGTTPATGEIVVNLQNEGTGAYSATLTATQNTPEPGTLALTALAFGGVLAWRRKKRHA